MKLENINNNILDDLNKRNDNWTKLDGVPERVDTIETNTFKIKNEIVNGDFRDGASGWTLISSTVTNKKIEINAFNGGARRDIVSNISDVYYSSITYSDKIGDVRYSNRYGYLFFELDGSGFYSRVNIGYGANTRVGLFLSSGTTGSIKIDNFKHINLTQTFGAGNEPTKEEMDLLISQIGYIDGEITLTQTQLNAWQLALIREKANKKQEEWITPTLLNGWEKHAVYEDVGFMKDSLGFVHLKGSIKGTQVEKTAFNLPAGYRPNNFQFFLVGTNAVVGSFSNISTAYISTIGAVHIYKIGDNVSLNGITFKAEK